MTRERAATDPVEITFDETEVGWIDIRIRCTLPDRRTTATHMADPFDDMLTWLEAVAAGAPMARWLVCQEGALLQVVFLSEARTGFDAANGRLVVLIGDWDSVDALGARAVTRMGLVRDVYGAFRRFAEGPDYRPTEWESMEENDDAWEGLPLRSLRSCRVEAALEGGPEQLPLPRLRW